MRRILAFALLGLIAMKASAQDMGWSTITPSITGTDTLGLTLRGQMRGETSSRTSGPDVNSRVQLPDPAALSYRSSAARRRTNLDNFVKKARARSTAAGEELTGIFASRNVLGELESMIEPYGLRIDNVGDALTLYWIVAWQTSRGNNNDFSRAKVAAVRSQAVHALVGMSSITGTSDSAKQEFAETLWVQSMLLDGAVGSAKGDKKILSMLAQSARQGARGMGIDLSTMSLTEQGFVPAG